MHILYLIKKRKKGGESDNGNQLYLHYKNNSSILFFSILFKFKFSLTIVYFNYNNNKIIITRIIIKKIKKKINQIERDNKKILKNNKASVA
jgi:hypothetical protein